jgi:hypothetical protein
LDLAFATKRLRRICEVPEVAEIALAQEAAGQLQDRLADIDAASCASELVAGSPSEVGANLVLDLGAGYTLTLRANHNTMPLGKNGRIQ